MYDFKVEAADKADLWRQIGDAAAALTAGEPDPIANMANVAALLWEALPGLNWGGFYRALDGELLLALALNDPALRRIDAASGSLDAEEFAAFFAAAQARGTLGAVDPADAAAAVIDLWGGAVRLWLLDPVAGALCRCFERRLAVLFAGLRP